MPLRSAHEGVQNGETLAAYRARQFRSIIHVEVIHFEETGVCQSPGSAEWQTFALPGLRSQPNTLQMTKVCA